MCPAGAPSDVWSLGCLLYELVTGRYLFADDDWIKMFVRVTKVEPRPSFPPHLGVNTSRVWGLPIKCFRRHEEGL